MQLPCGTPRSPIKLETPQKQLLKVYTVHWCRVQTMMSLGDMFGSVLRSQSVLQGASLVVVLPALPRHAACWYSVATQRELSHMVLSE